MTKFSHITNRYLRPHVTIFPLFSLTSISTDQTCLIGFDRKLVGVNNPLFGVQQQCNPLHKSIGGYFKIFPHRHNAKQRVEIHIGRAKIHQKISSIGNTIYLVTTNTAPQSICPKPKAHCWLLLKFSAAIGISVDLHGIHPLGVLLLRPTNTPRTGMGRQSVQWYLCVPQMLFKIHYQNAGCLWGNEM